MSTAEQVVKKSDLQGNLENIVPIERDPSALFEEYMAKAKLPQLHGVSQHVVAALISRVDNGSSLDIANIAKDLNLSKRTLQRHLKPQHLIRQ